MQAETAWVKPPFQVGGLDHLAVQATCINIYGRLLPGITNVTDRARYYSFYPWLIWAFDKAGHREFNDNFVERFRRADCLFCLVSQRHADVCGDDADDHSAAMVGSDTLADVARALGADGVIRLSDFSLREGAKKRYFANKLGGLGQYYLGVLRELSIIDGDATAGIRYTRQLGSVIAEQMDCSVNRALFMEAVDTDRVTAAELDALHGFCPCQLCNNPGEQKILGELFFVRDRFRDTEALPRQRSLKIILQLADLLYAKGEQLSEPLFRACIYSGSLPGGTPWAVPSALANTREKWAIYARNELLSIAVQGLFYALLDAYEASGLRMDASTDIANWFTEQREVLEALDELGQQRTFSECVADSKSWLPALADWSEKMHEVQLTERIAALSRGIKSAENRKQIVSAALKTLIALARRTNSADRQYADLVFEPDYFRYYPINLESFARHVSGSWASSTIGEVLRWLAINWGLEIHLRVALRKLRGQSQSTFRIRPSDRGMEVIAIPPAVHTRPRFNQAVRVLKDIGALEKAPLGWQLSPIGRAQFELADAQ
ncbi:hypothetical protein LQG66_27980 [Bradyrhizobium ontarionense]|uniref:Uncharacterized protein n=1 Tax=Bradyrhizobium ontarionense TaxID=2898149 RepID=A0ABY3R8B0_9BRAD|nr:hypothetical protein [Bradyrhizobium sp. A19]UFZ03056.1 hypothetical protein LQG66_27980 [Bradyrhizobium sp. A19]